VFRIAPTALEISLVCGILVRIKGCLFFCCELAQWFTDIQVWVGFCGYNCTGYGYIYSIYSKDYVVEVSRHGYSFICTYINVRLFRTRFRREANKADNKAASVAVDSLINFEAVKVRDSFVLWKKTTLMTF